MIREADAFNIFCYNKTSIAHASYKILRGVAFERETMI